MISDARGSHVSPGIYTEERDVAYSVKSLGITSLGLVGETLYGPAFQNVEIENWGEFVDYFGGTSTEKFPGVDGLPKYELPYIAKSYLEKSNRLNVVRVLGLSGYDAGKAFILKQDNKPVIVFREAITKSINSGSTGCSGNYTDSASSSVTAVTAGAYTDNMYNNNCGTASGNGSAISSGYAQFSVIVAYSGGGSSKTYNVSMDPSASNYIYKVFGTTPHGPADIYIESVFENLITGNNFTNTTDSNHNDYRTCFKAARTPWIVSEAMIAGSPNGADTVILGASTIDEGNDGGNTDTPTDAGNTTSGATGEGSPSTNATGNVSVRKLFRFHTISDGDASNYQVKVTIQKIDPINGTFDVVVRDFNDNDEFPIILERFSGCNLVEGDANYIAYKIGTLDGGFISKSRYIAVEMFDGNFENSIPAGFLGYPMPKYTGCTGQISLTYNTIYNPNVKAKKQCFGITKEDTDILSFKGVKADKELSGDSGTCYVTNGFHMEYGVSGSNVLVDGVSVCNFDCVTSSAGTLMPRLVSNKELLNNTIYKDINLRKFTVCFYGGFDGWDIYRDNRTNTDEFKATNYRVTDNVNSYTEGTGVRGIVNIPVNSNTSDYYAYLAGYRVFANPQDIDINIFATPGIDWHNNKLLTQEVIEMIEDADDGRGGDALYVMTAPNAESMEEMSDFLEHEINTSYACTYFPWVMYYDKSNKKYLELPVTKDVVRNMAETDNTSYPWFAPAGMQRGSVDCVKAKFKTSLSDEDELYSNNVNPVKSYAQDGVKIWGNKTMYDVESPLNRVNVRRLMIRVKKLVTDAAKSLIFEQYDDTLEKQFKGIVEPILADVKANRGIIDYRVITECTPETRDQHILPAKILIKPTQALEYISISFVVYPESVSFEE